MQTRRRFLKTVSTGGLVLLGTDAVEARNTAMTVDGLPSCSIPLRDGWEFRIDPAGATDAAAASATKGEWEAVQVPHTWQSLGRSPDYVGVA